MSSNKINNQSPAAFPDDFVGEMFVRSKNSSRLPQKETRSVALYDKFSNRWGVEIIHRRKRIKIGSYQAEDVARKIGDYAVACASDVERIDNSSLKQTVNDWAFENGLRRLPYKPHRIGNPEYACSDFRIRSHFTSRAKNWINPKPWRINLHILGGIHCLGYCADRLQVEQIFELAKQHAPKILGDSDVEFFKNLIDKWKFDNGLTKQMMRWYNAPRSRSMSDRLFSFKIHRDYSRIYESSGDWIFVCQFQEKAIFSCRLQTEEAALMLAGFADSIAQTHASESKLEEFKHIVKRWAFEQNLTHRLSIARNCSFAEDEIKAMVKQRRINSYPAEMQPTVETLIQFEEQIEDIQKEKRNAKKQNRRS